MKKAVQISTARSAVIAIVRGLAFALITLIYLLIPKPLSGYLWAVYVGFFLTMALGCKPGQLPACLCSLLCGFLWAFLYMNLSSWMAALLPALGTTACTVLAEFLLTGGLLFIHLRFFSGTVLGIIPALFAAVAMIFASGTLSAVPWCALSGCIGIGLAYFTNFVIGRAAKYLPPQG